MKLAPLILAAAFCLVAPAFAEPEPAVPAEAPAEPAAPAIPRIKVGGPCTYETTEIAATVIEVAEGSVLMSHAEDRNFNLGVNAFAVLPEPGDVLPVTKRKITKGTCQPLIYTLVVPPAEEPAPAN